jgi:hypothetical protein
MRSAFRALSSAQRAPSTISGILHICGTAESHKLGLGDLQDREVPVPVPGLDGVRMAHAACGKYHTAAVSADGDVYAWGLGSSGQLGLGSSRTKAHTPAKVRPLKPQRLPYAPCWRACQFDTRRTGQAGWCLKPMTAVHSRRPHRLRRRWTHSQESESARSRAARITRSQ